MATAQQLPMLIGYRAGDMWAPQLDITEALSIEAKHFIACVERRHADDDRRPRRACAWCAYSRRRTAVDRRARARIVELDIEQVRRMIPFRRSSSAVSARSSRRSTPPSCNVLRHRPVRPRRGGRGVRAGVRRLCRRRARHRRQLRGTSALHLRAARGRRRPRRRGHHRPVHLRRDGRGHRLHRRAAGVRRHRSDVVHDGRRRSSRRRSRRAPRRSCRCISTASRPTWIRSSRSRARTG